jgi:hypothetical protein
MAGIGTAAAPSAVRRNFTWLQQHKKLNLRQERMYNVAADIAADTGSIPYMPTVS